MDFSSPGLADLPHASADTLARGDQRVLGWLREAIAEGDAIIQSDPSYDQIEPALRYIVGEQLSAAHRKLQYLPQVTINESRKAVQSHVSALTDLKPLGGWRSLNPAFRPQSDLINLYAIGEWVTTFADMELGECIKYSLGAGTGDLVCDWDPHAAIGGQHEYSARDPRDTIPIRPGTHARSPQLWQGVILREAHTINAMQAKYPTKAYLFRPSVDSALTRVMGRFRSVATRLLSPADPLDQLQQKTHGRKPKAGEVVQYRAYLRDRTINLSGKPIVMGTPGAAWAYTVQPLQPLYPRGRLIVCTDDVILYDGPNTYRHGMYPVCRLRLWSVPWQFLGIPLFNDLLPVQDAINKTVHDIRLGIEQWMDPGLIFNRNAISEASIRTLDNRKPGRKLKLNPSFGDPYTKEEGPNAQVLALALELWRELTTKHNDLSGTANLTALLQLRQMPSADTIAKYFEALTPEIRQEARQIEAFIRDLSTMQLSNYFQFLTAQKAVDMLGALGVSLDQIANKPNALVPALNPLDPGYTPELDARLTTEDQRAEFLSKRFVFVAAPNSILGINAQEKKMMAWQEIRAGLIDFWTFHEIMETPNVGAPPAIPLPPLAPISPETQAAIVAQSVQNLGMGLPPVPFQDQSKPTPQTYIFDMMSGQIMEIRVPMTIVERLQAQQLLGIGLTENPAGRKASGQSSPQVEEKSDPNGGTRTTTTESDK